MVMRHAVQVIWHAKPGPSWTHASIDGGTRVLDILLPLMFYDDRRLAGKAVRVEVMLVMPVEYLVHALDVDLARNRSSHSRSLIVNLRPGHIAHYSPAKLAPEISLTR